VVADHGSLDVSFNVIAHPDHIGTPVLEMPYQDFEEPITRRLRTMWITSCAAAPHMIAQGSGVILTYGGYRDPVPNTAGSRCRSARSRRCAGRWRASWAATASG
jgi:NAD(P)-dependent dehydrogenase (short-subunit alcohol dehydrogenase family)